MADGEEAVMQGFMHTACPGWHLSGSGWDTYAALKDSHAQHKLTGGSLRDFFAAVEPHVKHRYGAHARNALRFVRRHNPIRPRRTPAERAEFDRRAPFLKRPARRLRGGSLPGDEQEDVEDALRDAEDGEGETWEGGGGAPLPETYADPEVLERLTEQAVPQDYVFNNGQLPDAPLAFMAPPRRSAGFRQQY